MVAIRWRTRCGGRTADEELGDTRPDRLYEVRPQERVQRRTVEQNVDNSLFLPTLDVPVPQMENRLFDVLIPEQAIAVPKISSSRHSHMRRVRFAEQTAEQLVEVPTIISYSSLRGIVEQNVDIPVPRGRGRVGLGLHPGHSSTPFGGAEFLPAATADQNVDIPVPRGAPRDFHQNPLPAADSSDLPDTANQGVFSTFPRRKKCEDSAHPGVGTGRGLQLMASVSLAGGVAGWLRH